MPRTLVRKTTGGISTEGQLEAALNAVKSGRPIREVGQAFSIAKSTFRLRLKTRCKKSAQLGRKTTFSEEQERELADCVLKLANIFYGLTPCELCCLAYDFAEANSMEHNFKKFSKQADKDWLALFLKRNPRISQRKPEVTNTNKVNSFNHGAGAGYGETQVC
jgi:hypothetical protein